ncbi:hypothetical protein AQUCO_01500429v1 [Aquilegia coerulea]|uniref:Uncharacterized protein n=1 Tax=Aquilegia coerulea TaxID=218851 RepID=A0A2G5DTQ1_AQUCA|nr:hypothetical protein AQUCO_01500429v1 [Aquilegia coerulea]
MFLEFVGLVFLPFIALVSILLLLTTFSTTGSFCCFSCSSSIFFEHSSSSLKFTDSASDVSSMSSFLFCCSSSIKLLKGLSTGIWTSITFIPSEHGACTTTS